VMPARGSVRGVRSSRTASISFWNTLFIVEGLAVLFFWAGGIMMLVRVREVDVLVARGVRFENEVFLF
jgi:hypothetical protein